MEQRDYLMKQFEQLGVVLAALLGFKSKGEYKKGFEMISDAYSAIPDFDQDDIEDIDPEEFLDKLTNKKPISFEKLNLIANFVYEEAEFYFLSGNTKKAHSRYLKALKLFNYINIETKIFSFEREEKRHHAQKIIKE